MADDEKKAIEFLKTTAKNAAKGLAEESEVYRVAENIVNDNKYLFGTVNTILNKELGVSFDVGKNKEIGFTASPDKASIGFKMSFEDGGFINKYAPGDTVTGALDTLTFEQVMDSRIEVLRNKYNTGAISKTALDQALRTKVRLFGGTHNKIKYSGVLQNAFPDINPKEILFNQINSEDGIKKILTSAGENQAWFKGKPGAATDFWKSIQGAIGNTVGKSGYNAASAFGKDNPLILQGMKLGRGPVFESETYRSVAQQLKTIKDPNSRRLAKIMLLTGIRETDLVRLKASDIDFVNNTITTFSGKGAGAQVIPISDSVKTLLQQQTNINPTGATIFSKPKIKASNLASHYSKNINAALNKIDILDTVKNTNRAMTLEDLRRAFSMRATALGISSDVVDSLMGHTVKGTKAIYQKGTTSTALKSKNIVEALSTLDKDLFIQLGFETSEDAVAFTEGKFKLRGTAGTTLGQQVEEVIPSKTTAQPIVSTQTVKPKPIVEPKVTIVDEPELKKSQTSVSGNKYTELPSPNSNKIKLALDKSKKTAKLAGVMTILSKIGKAATIFAPIEPVQVINEAFGGEEGFLPTKDGKLLGVFEPTITKDVEATQEFLGMDKKNNKQIEMPEEMEQFEQQGRL